MPVDAVDELRFQVLGPLRVWRDGAEVDSGPRQQALLLTLLLTRVGRPVSTAELIDLIWGDEAPASALNVIHKYVGALRRVLEPRLPARESGGYLHRRGNSYLFTADADRLDLVAFRGHVRSAAAAEVREAALDHYLRALDLWRGPAGGGTATALDDEFYRACTAAADLAVSVGRPDRVLPALHLATSMAPFHEPVQAALVTALGAAGRQAEALAVFRTVRERLADELGIDPGPALQQAHHHVLAQPPLPVTTVEPARPESDLVGRVEEFALLRRTVEGALTGGSAIGVVEGEPGVGKTRLLQEAAAVATRGDALVVWGRCLEGAGTPSMWPWEQALGRIVAGLPAPAREKWLAGELGSILEPRDGADRTLPDGNAQFRLFEQAVALVGESAAQRPILLILDDLQWADVASLQLFHHLAGRLPGGTAMIAALRDRAPTLSPALSRVLATASRVPGHRRLRLGPLGLGEVAALVRTEVGRDPDGELARAIHDRTAGNPFFVLELSRLLSEKGSLGVPNTIRDVVRSRMAGLDDHARDLLQVAALIGRDVDLRLLSRATGVGVADCMDRLEPVQALGLLEPGPEDPSSMRFAHDLVRESVSETTAKQQIIRLHLRVADALEQTHADDEVVAERLAYHLWAAGPLVEPVRTAEALIRAGRCAAGKLAFDSANRQLRYAVQVTRSSGLMDLELAALTLLAIVVRRQAGFDASTVDLLDRAEYLAGTLGRAAEAADFLFIRTMGAYTALEKDRDRLARRMHEMGQGSTDPAVRRYGRQSWGLHQWDVGNIGEAVRLLSEKDHDTGVLAAPQTPLRRDGAIPGEGPGWWAVTTALHDDVPTALALVDSWDAPNDPYAASVWVYYTTMIASMAGDADLARRAGERWATEDLERLNAQIGHYVRQSRCWARALTGDDPAGAAAEAEEHLAANLADPPQWGVAFHHALVAEMWLAAGRCDRATAALDRADRAAREYGQRYAEGLSLLLKARLLQARGEPSTVVRAAAEQASSRSRSGGALLFARRADEFLAG
ncbi:hypothetical protein Q0Z83_047910 [Actinoplanes sichuanensis]|uniref:ATP-binding protein n=1 Tax=Actinoplanes sichuanensis TaxID=512349 RepID=A0ABW4ANP7_9ACTN|nr:BTAD domain-containing putative transcriptional regulator [Actinoplanes sichuanensis]BEL06600.1 hypothetical protein Q0Z83_047910 [Actinoplanes sichuanensis]